MEINEILKQRAKTHGDFGTQAFIAQMLKDDFWNTTNNKLTHTQKEAIDMIFHKIARICAGDPNEPDHWDDIAGYAKLAADELRRQKEDEGI